MTKGFSARAVPIPFPAGVRRMDRVAEPGWTPPPHAPIGNGFVSSPMS